MFSNTLEALKIMLLQIFTPLIPNIVNIISIHANIILVE